MNQSVCTKWGFAAYAALATSALSAVAMADNPKLDKASDLNVSVPLAKMYAVDQEEGYIPVRGGFVARDAAECGLATGSPNCQDWTRTAGTAGRSSDLVGIAALNGDDFATADNFTITSAQTLTNICFWGFYVSTTNAVGANGAPTAGNEAFRIRLYGNTGGASPGIPDSANVIHEWTVGANAGYNLTVDPNTTLTRGPVGATRPGVFAWSVALAGASQVSLQPGCYWLEIVGATNGIPEGARLRWAIVNGASAVNDGVVYQEAHSEGPYSYQDLIGGTTTATDMAFCLNFALATNNCSIPPAPTNSGCGTAQVVGTLPFSASNVSTLRSLTTATPFCGRNPVNGNTLWYQLTGDGTTVTVDTCGSHTNFDTVINVYCSASGCGTGNVSLNCVANNDTGPAACTGDGGAATDPSQVSFVATSGVVYYVAVYGFELDAGFLDLSITSDGVQAANPPACVSDRCPLDISGVANVEADPCGTTNNSACNGTSVGMFTLGQDMAGTSYNLGTTRDFDFWEYNTATPLPDNSGGAGNTWLDLTYQVEFPGIFNIFTGTCNAPTNNGTFVGGANAEYRALATGCGPRHVIFSVAAGSQLRINLLPVDFGGVPCGAGNNNYKMSVNLATVGACCLPFTVCQVTPQISCDVTNGGLWVANGACSPTDFCSGVCCTGTSCTVSAASDCTAAGSTYQGGVAGCTPNPCLPQTGTCCRGATCTTGITQANCTVASGTAGANYMSGSSTCNSGNVSNTPCCYANYNKVNGISVQDIFDFLGDWFAGSPYARVGGDGTPGPLAVQNIFDFLSNWFAGGCQ